MSPIAKVYWRTVKRRTRAYSSIPDELKTDVKSLAAKEVSSGSLSVEEYEQLIGETYAQEVQA
ncbi:MAG: hypothetical protein SO072_07690 [Dysosmobacter sp.]|nr:hypothetical protein [Dysosmobacter sp.]